MCKWICFNRLSCNDSGEAEQLHSSNSQGKKTLFFHSLKPILLVLIMETGCDSFLNLHHVCILLILWSESSELCHKLLRTDKLKPQCAERLSPLFFTCRPADFCRLQVWLDQEEVKPPPMSAKQETQTHTHPRTAFNSYPHMHLYFTH